MKYFVKEYDTRYFAGIEFPNGVKVNTDDLKKIPKLWDEFFEKYSKLVPDKLEPNHLIGLEIYPFDFMDTGIFDYSVMVETNHLVEPPEGMITRKLKAGRYICFPIEFDQISSQIKKVYEYVKEKKINVHMGIDYEDYLPEENYGEQGAILNFCFLLEKDVK